MTRFIGTPLRGIEFSSVSDEAVSARVASDNHPRIRIDAGGRITWSPGNSAGDVLLYRDTDASLRSDSIVKAPSGIVTLAAAGAPTAVVPDGGLAVNTTTDTLYVRSGGEWVQVAQGSLPGGGLEGQILAKTTDTNYDVEWIDNYTGDLRIICKNDSGATITKGSPVSASGAVGDRIQIVKAIADGTQGTEYFLGLAAVDIANGAEGYVQLLGEIRQMNTAAYPIGTVLYISPTTAGTLTSTAPSAPNPREHVAIVTRSHATTGILFVRMWHQSESIGTLNDVLLTSPASNDVLRYDGTKWVNQSVLASVAPLALAATAAVGTATTAARADHVHPTTGLAVLASANTFTVGGQQIINNSASVVALNIKAATGQSENMLAIRGAAGDPGGLMAAIGPTGRLFTSTGLDVYGSLSSAQVYIENDTSTRIGAVIRAATSQTANLQEWRNSSGNVLSYVTSTGIHTANYAFDFNSVTAPGAPTASVLASAGNVDIGTHYYYVTYTTSDGETELGTISSAVSVTSGNQQVQLTIPVSSDYRVTGRKIYRTIANGATWQVYPLATIANNTATTYVDNIADSSITSGGLSYARDNTTIKFMRNTGVQAAFAGRFNTFFGRNAGATITANTTASGYNTGFGVGTLASITTGTQNTAIGNEAGTRITTGSDNVAIGHYALGGTVTNSANIAIGRNSLTNLTSGQGNTVIGYFAGAASNVTGLDNTAIGNQSINALTSGGNNVAIGRFSANTLTTGSSNTIVGADAGRAVTTTSNNVFIGANAGRYATGTAEFYVDTYNRTNNTNEKVQALMYGTFNASAASQTLTINAATTVGYGLNVVNSTDIKAVLVKGAVGQTALLQDWQNSAGTTLVSISASGNLGIGVGSTASWTPFAVVAANDTANNTTTVGSFPASIHRANGSNGQQVGIAFTLLGDTSNPSTFTPGAVIAHERVGLSSQGDLVFKVKNGGSTNGTVIETLRLTYQGNIGVNTSTQFGAGERVIGIANATTVPTTDPTNGGVLYSESGALKWRSSGGAVTTIATTLAADVGSYAKLARPNIFTGGQQTIEDLSAANDAEARLVYLRAGADGTLGPLEFGISLVPSATGSSRYVSIGSGDFSSWRNIVFFGGVGSSANGRVAIGGTAAAGRLHVSSSAPAVVGVVVRGAASQTADLQQWQNSSGNSIARVGPSGGFYVDNTSGVNLWRINPDGEARFGSNAPTTGQVSIASSVSTNIGILVRGATSQTANLQEWQNSAGTVLASVTAAGVLNGTDIQAAGILNISGSGYLGSRLNLITGGGANPGVLIRGNATSGTADQTADLLRFQTGATGNAVLAGFNALGQSYTGSTAPFTVATGGATTATSGTGTVCTITTTSAHGLAAGDLVTVAGVTPTTYNGTFLVSGTPSSTEFTYAHTATGSQTVAGTVSTPAQMSVAPRSAATVGFRMIGVAGQVADLVRIGTSAGTALGITGSGLVSTPNGLWSPQINNPATSQNAAVVLANGGTQITTAVASNVALTVQNTAATPTADLTRWLNTSGGTVASIGNGGLFFTNSDASIAQNLYVGTGTFFGSRVNVAIGQADRRGIVVRAFTGQTANLQEWQNSAGTVMSAVGSNGAFDIYSQATTAIPLTITGIASQSSFLTLWRDNGANTLSAISSSGAFVSNVGGHSISSASTGTIGLVVKAASGQTTQSIQEWQTSGGSTQAKIDANGTLTAQSFNALYSVSSLSGGNTVVPLTVTGRGVGGVNTQTANLAEFKTGATGNAVLGGVSADGYLFTGSTAVLNTSGGSAAVIQASVQASAAGTRGLVIRGAASQTANLQEWQNSAGTVLGQVDSAGRFSVWSVGTGNANPSGVGWLLVTPAAGNPTTVVQVNRGLSDQTGDLLQNRNSSNTVLGGANALAQTFTGSTAPITVGTGGAVSGTSSGTTATLTTASAHGLAVGDLVTIAGMTPSGYNGTYLVGTVPTTTSFTVTTSGSNLGNSTVSGTVSAPAQASITARSAGTVGLVVRGAASAVTDIFRVTNSSGTSLFNVNQNGDAVLSGSQGLFLNNIYNITAIANSRVSLSSTGTQVLTGVAANVALTVQNTAGTPTGNLTEWRGTGTPGTLLARVDSSGSAEFVNLTLSGNLTVNGTTTTVNSVTTTLDDPIITLGGDSAPSTDDNKDRGVEFRWHNGTSAKIGFFGWDDSTEKFTFIPDATNSSEVFSGALGTIDVGAVHINGSQISASSLSNSTTGTGAIVLAQTPTLSPAAATNIGLIVRGFASQSANLQEWQDSTGTVLTTIQSGGNIVSSGTAYFPDIANTSTANNSNVVLATGGTRILTAVASNVALTVQNTNASPTGDLTRWLNTAGAQVANISSSGSMYLNQGIRVYDAPAGIASLSVQTPSTTLVGAMIRGRTSQSADLQQWQDVSGTVYTRVDGAGRVAIRTSVLGLAVLSVATDTSSSQGIIVRGAASQTANLQEWQTSDGAVQAGVSPFGSIFTGGSSVLGRLTVSNADAATKNVVIRGAVSQTANLQEWQNSAGTIIGAMSAAGAFSAVTKSFDIEHPTKDGMRLRYGSLEGPENGVYVRGKSGGIIELPDYWTGLVDPDSVTVQLTPIGKPQNLFVEAVRDNAVYVGGAEGEFFYFIQAERIDVDRLVVEYVG